MPSLADALSYNGGTGASALARSQQEMRLDRTCQSACALSWAINPNACWAPGAKLGFHSPYDPGTGKAMPQAARWWDEQLQEAANALAAYIGPLENHHGLLPNGQPDMAWVDTNALAVLMPERRCK